MTKPAADSGKATRWSEYWTADLISALLDRDSGVLAEWLKHHEFNPNHIHWLQGQGLASFVYYHLQRAGLQERLSDAARIALQSIYYIKKAQSILLMAELDSLLVDLRRENIEPIVLKGMALAHTVYPAPFTRPMGDLDFLIERHEVETVKEVFARRCYHEMGLHNERLMAFPAHLHAWREYPGGQRLTIESHWSLFHESIYRNMDLSTIRARAQSMIQDGRSIRVLDPIDQLLHACGHLLIHHPSTWIAVWLLDLRLIIDRYGLAWNWPEVVNRARDFKLAGALRYWLETAERWCGPFLMPAALNALSAIVPYHEEMWYLKAAQADSLRVWQVFWKRGSGLSWRAQIRLYGEIFFPPWNYIQYRYHARSRWLAPLYYAWRWLRAMAVFLRRYRDFKTQYTNNNG